MTTVTFHRHQNSIVGFQVHDHSGYAPEGEDIVCAAISMIVINTINSIETLTDSMPHETSDAETATITCFPDHADANDVQLLLKSLHLGLTGIQESYGNRFIKVLFKEV